MSNPYDKTTVKHSSVLGPTLKFKGKLTANENLLIQGQVEGTIKHSSLLTIGKEGTLKAKVSAEYISVEGKVVGDLASTNSVVVNEGANVEGNISCPKVTLRDGATFNGSIDMSGEEEAKSSDKHAAVKKSRPKKAANDDIETEAESATETETETETESETDLVDEKSATA